MNLQVTLLAAVAAIPLIAFAGDPVNENCPISGRPINPKLTTTVGEDTVAFCCGGCTKGFLKWEEEKQLTYITEQKASSKSASEVGAIGVSAPYLLDTCPVSGQKLGEMGDPVVKTIDGREVRFCCGGCVEKFEENKKSMFAKLDKQMIANQLPYYPMTTCILSGEELDEHDASVDFILGNRLFRVCCNDCKSMLSKKPGKFVAELDEAIIKAQKKDYPLTTCVIGKGPLDGMGGPDYMVVGTRLVQLCCAGCREKVLEDPLAAFKLIDDAKK